MGLFFSRFSGLENYKTKKENKKGGPFGPPKKACSLEQAPVTLITIRSLERLVNVFLNQTIRCLDPLR